ncbi:hypothetical protein GALMADRAFT_219673 [Galerina marginata CBS 339.88]|uniref:F-box domain-containing protein n=1 Tax=Galerina marginata (strain CBS 339.88) TaxID=685588 RepID=A0A067TV77_GALM3|nr:hypothetical protein GALMADRAFT_219673 [Galerina marginata CBS 339.88]
MSSILSDVDVNVVHETISKHEEAVLSLDTEIDALMRAIRQLQYQKQQHLEEIKKCKGRITLARRLPPEILASIFEECVLDGWTRTPLVASHTCSSWRKAAYIPTVWSHIYVNLGARDPCQRTRLWLDRSEDTLLTIDLEVGPDQTHLKNIMEVLLTEVQRWKVLTIKSTFFDPVNRILQTCNKPTPQLRTIDVSVDQEFILAANNADDNAHELAGLRTSFVDAPLFRSLRISRNILPGRQTLPSSITNLYLRLPCHHPSTTQSLSSILRLLEELPNIETLSMEVPNGHHQHFQLDVEGGDSVELANLKSLTLMGSNNMFGFLPHVRVSSLTHLVLRSSLDYFQAEEIGSWVLRFLQESSPPISLLEFRDLALDSRVYHGLFAMLPLLEELRLHDSDILDIMLEQLNGPQGLCPLLKRLDLRWCGRLSGRAVVELVRSRLRTDTDNADISSVSLPLAEITLINCSFVKEENIVDLAEITVCRLIHRGQDDFCKAYGCCDNERYRRRLKQRSMFHPSIRRSHAKFRLVF